MKTYEVTVTMDTPIGDEVLYHQFKIEANGPIDAANKITSSPYFYYTTKYRSDYKDYKNHIFINTDKITDLVVKEELPEQTS